MASRPPPTIARTEIVPEIAGIDGVASADITGGLEQRLVDHARPDQARRERRVRGQQIVGRAAGQQPDVPVGSALRATAPRSRSPRSVRFTSSERDRGPRRRLQRRTAPTVPTARSPPRPTPAPPRRRTGRARPRSPSATSARSRRRRRDDRLRPDQRQPVADACRSPRRPMRTPSIVAEAVQAKLAEIGERPSGRADHHDRVATCPTSSRNRPTGSSAKAASGALFAILTIFLFLFSIRSTIVAAISIPLSILTALVIMQLTGISLNIMTLGGLAVAVGRVVDDAIVVLENIYRHRALGEDRMTAVLNGPREVAGAITASTLTTVAVFLPLGFVGGLVSQFFLPFALTVTFALLASLICALTVVPVLAYFLIDKVKMDVDEDGEPKRSHLGPRLHPDHQVRVLRSRWTTLGVVAVSRRPVLRLAGPRARSCRPSSSTPARRRSSRSASRRPPGATLRGRPRPGHRGRDDPPGRPRRGARSRRPSRARATPASRRSSPRRAAGPPTARR